MKPRLHLPLLLLALAFLAGLCGRSADAHEYRIRRVTRLNRIALPFSFGFPAINDRGQIAFRDVRQGADGVFRSDGGRFRLIGRSAQGRHPSGSPSINDRGVVAYTEGGDEGWSALYRGSGGQPTRIADSTGPFRGVDDPSLNNEGDVVFGAQLDDLTQGIFLSRDGEISTVAQGENSIVSLLRPMINDRREITYHRSSEPGQEAILLHREEGIVTIADTSGPFSVLRSPSLNADGTVVFMGLLEPGESGIFAGQTGPLTTVADTTRAFNGFGDRISINDRGHVAFTAFDLRGEGLYVADGPVITPVIRVGDRLEDSRVEVIGLGREGLNNRGEVTFMVMLSNRKLGIYVATAPRGRR